MNFETDKLGARSGAKETTMPKGQEKPGKNNKPKLSPKEKKQKKKEKLAAKGRV
jgi:hypothetical protein